MSRRSTLRSRSRRIRPVSPANPNSPTHPKLWLFPRSVRSAPPYVVLGLSPEAEVEGEPAGEAADGSVDEPDGEADEPADEPDGEVADEPVEPEPELVLPD